MARPRRSHAPNRLLTDAFREIRKTRSRFISLLVLSALAVCFLAGLRATAPDMKLSADRYFDGQKLMDLRVAATLGLTEKDVEALAAAEGVEAAEGAYTVDAILSDEENTYIVKVLSLTDGINLPRLTEGRMPVRENEILVEPLFIAQSGLKVGDRVKLDTGDGDFKGAIRRENFTICGVADSPLYINAERGSSSLGTGRVAAFVLARREAFDMEAFTEVYLRVKGAEELPTYSDEYENLIDGQVDLLEELADVRAPLRSEEVLDEANEKLADARQDLADAREEVAEELADAEAELADARKELDDGWQEYLAGQRELKDKTAEGLADLEEAKADLEQGEIDLEEARDDLIDGWFTFYDNKRKYEDGVREYEDGMADYRDGYRTYMDGKAEYEDGLAKYEDGRADLEAARSQLDAGESSYTAGRNELDGQLTQIYTLAGAFLPGVSSADDLINKLVAENGTGAVTNQVRTLQALAVASLPGIRGTAQEALDTFLAITAPTEADLAQIAALRNKIAMIDSLLSLLSAGDLPTTLVSAELALRGARAGLDSGWAQYNSGRSELASAKHKLDEAKEDLDEAKADLKSGRLGLMNAEYELKDAARQLADGEQELLDGEEDFAQGKQDLADGWEEYKDGEKEFQRETAKARRKLADALVDLQDGEREYADGVVEYEDGRREAEEELADAEDEILKAQRDVDEIEDCEWYLLDRNTNMGYLSYSMDADRMGNLADVFPLIFFLVAALVCLTTMTRMVEEQRVAIGGLKALGYGKAAIAVKYVGYGFLASSIGAVIGLAVGLSLVPWIICSAWSVMYATGPIYYSLEPVTSLVACLAAVGTVTLSALAACFSTLSAVPAELMRPKAPPMGKRILLERIRPLWRRLSFNYKITLRNLFRYKRRFCMTVIGIGGCAALIVTAFGMRDSLFDVMDVQYDEIYRYTARVGLVDKVTPGELRDVEKVLTDSGLLKKWELCRSELVTAETDAYTVDAYVQVMEDGEAADRMISLRHRRDGEKIDLTDNGVVISEKLATLLEVGPGDVFTADGDERVELRVADVTENYIQHYIYMTDACYRQIYGEEPEKNIILLDYDIRADGAQELASSLVAEDGVTSLSIVDDTRRVFANSLDSVDYAVVLIIVCAAALAFVVLYNLTNINITERMRELATLKVLGFYDGELSAYIYRENVILTVFGVGLGMVLGKFLHQWLILTVEIEMLMFGRSLKPESYGWAVVLTVIFSLAVNLAAHRKLKKLDMVESLKTME